MGIRNSDLLRQIISEISKGSQSFDLRNEIRGKAKESFPASVAASARSADKRRLVAERGTPRQLPPLGGHRVRVPALVERFDTEPFSDFSAK